MAGHMTSAVAVGCDGARAADLSRGTMQVEGKRGFKAIAQAKTSHFLVIFPYLWLSARPSRVRGVLKALIFTKFILIGVHLKLDKRFAHTPLIRLILIKSTLARSWPSRSWRCRADPVLRNHPAQQSDRSGKAARAVFQLAAPANFRIESTIYVSKRSGGHFFSKRSSSGSAAPVRAVATSSAKRRQLPATSASGLGVAAAELATKAIHHAARDAPQGVGDVRAGVTNNVHGNTYAKIDRAFSAWNRHPVLSPTPDSHRTYFEK